MSRNLFLPLIVCLVFVSPPRSTAQRGGGTVVTELWCVAKNNAEDASLQGALDWACGQGGANCNPVQQGGACYDPTDIQKTASYAFNDYYLKNGMTDDACSFSNNAALTSLNPSYGNCKFPSSKTVNNASISESTGTLGVGPDSTADLSSSHRIAQSWLILALSFIHFGTVRIFPLS
ncbi:PLASMODESMATA CALLOSE-BINDING PROTEIN 5 [Hibiscus syriacus]|uniref:PLASMODESMATA CALLOSE-BINDING PROTEIN 5 n=1 Tax=Hibiscus syriacus TaxID=106335 RepID=A0A6A2XDR7_HIBSY|nr:PLASMODESMATA CALLOSE-BINDING PROTEIN 5-like [Hibiscus syriacus]KAE8673921.1 PLASMODESMATA CALLOSE-BINDING PROTEIN 5 [Hibiscus syriacus]